jgi:hypothetical protein
VLESTLLLLVKLVAVPVLVLSASLAARRWGPSVGGFIIGLPLTSGPVLVFLGIEQGSGFASAAAVGTLLGVVPLTIYCLTFGRLGLRVGWQANLLASTVVYLLIAAVLSRVDASMLLALGAALLAITLSLVLIPRGPEKMVDRAPPRWEIPARMVAATVLVILLTEGASFLGPRWSGLLAPYPIYATVFAVFMQRYDGPKASVPFLKGVIEAAPAATAFFFVFGSALAPLGVAWAAFLALCATALVEGGTLFFGRGLWKKPAHELEPSQGRPRG